MKSKMIFTSAFGKVLFGGGSGRFSSSSSFRDLSPLAVGETPSQSAAAVAGSYASALKERFLRRPSFFQNHHQQQARAFGAGPKEIKTA